LDTGSRKVRRLFDPRRHGSTSFVTTRHINTPTLIVRSTWQPPPRRHGSALGG